MFGVTITAGDATVYVHAQTDNGPEVIEIAPGTFWQRPRSVVSIIYVGETKLEETERSIVAHDVAMPPPLSVPILTNDPMPFPPAATIDPPPVEIIPNVHPSTQPPQPEEFNRVAQDPGERLTANPTRRGRK